MSLSEWHACLQPGDGAIDIGANVGAVTRHLAKRVGPTGCVIAVEPDPRAVTMLRQTVQGFPWVRVMEMAVSGGLEVRPLYLSADSPQNSFWAANTLKADGASIAVPTITLDTLAANVPNLKAIKIDTQGAEVEVLKGGQETLQRKGLVWHVEFWPTGLRNAWTSPQVLADMFSANGYHPQGRSWEKVLASMAHMDGHKSVDVVVSQ